MVRPDAVSGARKQTAYAYVFLRVARHPLAIGHAEVRIPCNPSSGWKCPCHDSGGIITPLMPLAPGTRLGPYEIGASLGAGGMGEVYRALDTRLDRTVAIKILPEQLSADPVGKQRFEREAKTISRLNHPHICVLHDIGH